MAHYYNSVLALHIHHIKIESKQIKMLMEISIKVNQLESNYLRVGVIYANGYKPHSMALVEVLRRRI